MAPAAMGMPGGAGMPMGAAMGMPGVTMGAMPGVALGSMMPPAPVQPPQGGVGSGVLAALVAGQQQQQARMAEAAKKQQKPSEETGGDSERWGTDPDVLELCEHFNCDKGKVEWLDETMKNRQATFEGDMLKLWECMGNARNPEAMLVMKIHEMEDGTFVGKPPPDKDLDALVKKYNLDSKAKEKLGEVLALRQETKK